MAFNKDNSGSLSKNDRKEKETHPDIKGKATIGGVEYWVDGWAKETDGRKWYSLSFKPKDATRQEAAPTPTPMRRAANGDDIPFVHNACMYLDEAPLLRRVRRAR
jgi:hypothetical protein